MKKIHKEFNNKIKEILKKLNKNQQEKWKTIHFNNNNIITIIKKILIKIKICKILETNLQNNLQTFNNYQELNKITNNNNFNNNNKKILKMLEFYLKICQKTKITFKITKIKIK